MSICSSMLLAGPTAPVNYTPAESRWLCEMGNDRITLYGTNHSLNDESDTIDVSLRLGVGQAKRINRQVPEAMSLQEGIRSLLEEALQTREERMTPEDIERAVKRAIGDVEALLESGELKVIAEKGNADS